MAMRNYYKINNECSNEELNGALFDDLDNCATQDACDIGQYFENDSNHSLTDDNHDQTDEKPKLRLITTNQFKDFSETATVLSPISELALNIAKTKLVLSTDSTETGKLNQLTDVVFDITYIVLNEIICLHSCNKLHVIQKAYLTVAP